MTIGSITASIRNFASRSAQYCSTKHLAAAFSGSGTRRISDVDPNPWVELWEDEPAKKLYMSILDSFVSEAKNQGACPVIMLFPRRHEAIAKAEGNIIRGPQIFMKECRKRNFSCFDGLEAPE